MSGPASSLLNTLAVIGAVSLGVAVNAIIVGLVLIALIHDGSTGAQVASSFETVLTALVGVAGTLVGGAFTGRMVHTASMNAQTAQEAKEK